MLWRKSYQVWVVVVASMAVWAAGGEVTHSSTPINRDSARLQEIRKKILDVVGNSTSTVYSMSGLMNLLHTDTGRELGRLLVEGVMLGVQQKDRSALLGQFWKELQERVSPELLEAFDDYRDFFSGIDMATVPLMWEQIFQKDELGNSLAGIPLGQLVDLVQPSAAKYGIDIRAFVSSLMGKGDNNAKDLIINAISNLDLSTFMNSFLNSTSNTKSLQVTESDHKTTTNTRPKNEEKQKTGKGNRTLRLFRPLVASLLREYEVDLDADAVLDVLSPLLSGDLLAQAAPLLAMFGSQAGGGLSPIIANLLGGGGGQQKQQQMGGLLGGLGALLASGGENKMDLDVMINLASMFMDSGKPSKKNTMNNKKKENPRNSGFDLGTLVTVAGQLAEKNDINVASILDTAARFLKPDSKKKSTQPNNKAQQIVEIPASEKRKPVKETSKSQPPKVESKATPKPNTTSKKSRRQKNLIDVLEPILLSMQTDKKCNRKIKDAIQFGKAMLNNKMASLGDISQLIPFLLSSVMSGDTMNMGLNTNDMVAAMKQALAYASWSDFMESFENENYRETFIRSITPHMAQLLVLLANQGTQDRLYDEAIPRIEAFLGAYGLPGVTLHNFPERLAPIVGLLAKGWSLPFNPTTILVPLRDYLKGLQAWAKAGLTHLRSLSTPEVETLVMRSLEEEVSKPVSGVMTKTSGASPECLPQLLCQVNSGLPQDSLKAAVTRIASLVLASGPVLEESDSSLLVKTVQAISGTTDQCKEVFPGNCTTEETDDDDMMNLDYEHQEL
ncbi:uncharacterized protein LOC121857339 [Homarus americanus]|uniref:Uncharacterized protein n=1 Tax=Homarus americanus TaxID=6706 RepID=A0A8J5JFJ9_HOMAM|nr:uncharacterized protein LOC121857339 [Homarus americanus]KAG7153598.1 hypothetical protein Hamer_G019497 [Homarus americanus]